MVSADTRIALSPGNVWTSHPEIQQLRQQQAAAQTGLALDREAILIQAEPPSAPALGPEPAAEVMLPMDPPRGEPPVLVPDKSRGRYMGAALYFP